MKDNNKTNYTNITLNSTSRGCKAEPYPFSASAVIQSLFKATCPPLEGGPKSLISRRGENTVNCFNTYNDKKCRHPEGNSPKDLQTFESRFFAYAQNDAKNVKDLFPYCPISLSLNKKIAFTLAETLITLGIIGIVAAMTIPTLISNHQKKVTVTKIEKAISYLNQAYKLSYDDVGEPTLEESFEMNSKDYFNKYWAPYLKILQYCDTYSGCNYKSNTPYKTINNNDIGTMIIHPNGATFLTFDGYMFNIRSNYANQLSRLIILDINGSQGPNKFGKDVFFLSRVEEDGGGIRCYCYEKTDTDISEECSNKGEGYCCAEKIRRAGWKIENSYPWK